MGQTRSSFYSEGVIDALAQRAEMHERSTVLHVGTGTGFIAACLAPRSPALGRLSTGPREPRRGAA